MDITLANNSYQFVPWNPRLGRVFAGGFAFDSETTLINEEHPGITPAYVLGAAFDGARGYFITRTHAAEFFSIHAGLPIAMHHAAFDLAVLDVLAPDLGVYDWVDRNHVWDTQLLHRLHALGTAGHTAGGKGESTLEYCVQHHLGVELTKDVRGSQGNLVRLSYGRWLNKPPQDIDDVYLEYLAKDVIATHILHRELSHLLQELNANSEDVWGFVSRKWLKQRTRRWGPQTHHIQLKASIVLETITANGLHLDMARRDELVANLQTVVGEQRKALATHGYLPGKGSAKALEAIFARLERKHRDLSFPKTETGKYATSHDVIQELADTVPFVKLLMEYRETDKLLNSFLKKMGKAVLHPSFGVLARSGRTSSFGAINAQNLPKDDRVRACFVPSPRNVFIDADYSTVEMATLAQSCVAQFGLESAMAKAINCGRDLHRLVAARVTGKAEKDVSKAERQKAKPINFGKPGGMSNTTLQQYANVTYGVGLTEIQVEELTDAWFDLFPEMDAFLNDDQDLGLEIASLLELTLASHQDHTGDGRFLKHPENAGHQDTAHKILGWMSLKAFKQQQPCTKDGKPYRDADLDYFWSQLAVKRDLLPPKFHTAVVNRQPSPRLRRAVMNLVGRASVYTLSGRLRANAPYCARRNTVFQGLAADGMKLAMWKLWRAGYRIVNEVHDQFLIEVPIGSNLKRHAERIKRLMIEGMKEVVPDVKVDVSYAACDRWCKDAEAVFTNGGNRLVLWQPTHEETRQPGADMVTTGSVA